MALNVSGVGKLSIKAGIYCLNYHVASHKTMTFVYILTQQNAILALLGEHVEQRQPQPWTTVQLQTALIQELRAIPQQKIQTFR